MKGINRSILLTVFCVGAVLGLSGTDVLSFKETPATTVLSSRTNKIRYVSLGDSFTIGNSVDVDGRWPNQVAKAYTTPSGKKLDIVANLAVGGYTSKNLINDELPEVSKLKPDFVTVQIGANDYLQRVGPTRFESNLKHIIATLQAEMDNPKGILLVTIPDFTKTPAGSVLEKDTKNKASLQKYNQIISKLASENGLTVADVYPISQQVSTDLSLVGKDGLHPSSKQYSQWANIIFETLKTQTKAE